MSRSASVCMLLVFASVALAGCLGVDKLPPGPQVIDDFEDGDLLPRLKGFKEWTCETVDDTTDGGTTSDVADASTDAGPPVPVDGGSSATCALEHMGDQHSCCGLAMTFDLHPKTPKSREYARAFTYAPVPVDFTRFQTFVFSSMIEAVGDLPSGTLLLVELGCSKIQPPAAPTATLNFSFELGSYWTATHLRPMTFNHGIESTNAADCLVQVDSIGFRVVEPGVATATTGTLHIDNVYLLE